MYFYTFSISIYCILFSLNDVSTQNFQDETQYNAHGEPHTELTRADIDKRLILFKSEEDIISFFSEERYRDPELVDSVIASYYACFNPNETYILPHNLIYRSPFVVLEGNNRTIKEIVAKILAGKMAARFFSIPPKCMVQFNAMFDRSGVLRNAYFQLCMYVVASKVKQTIARGRPAVLNGYWYGQASFLISKLFLRPGNLPRRYNAIYSPPKDLFMPDMLVYLNIPSKTSISTPFPGWTPKPLQIYGKFIYPPVVTIDYHNDVYESVRRILEEMQYMIGTYFDLRYDDEFWNHFTNN